MAHYALVLGCDQDRLGLGPKTKARLDLALLHQRMTGATLVVAAGKANDFDEAMGGLMVAYLKTNGCCDQVKLDPDVHNTYGEVKVFVTYLQQRGDVTEVSVISGTFHLWRIRMLLRRCLGIRATRLVQCVGVESEKVGWQEEYILEPVKLLNSLMPPIMRRLGAKILNKVGVRAQY